MLLLLLLFSDIATQQSDAGYEAQYSHHDTQPDLGILGICINVKCTRYGSRL